eukprot:192920-Rhodomonas_salina.1
MHVADAPPRPSAARSWARGTPRTRASSRGAARGATHTLDSPRPQRPARPRRPPVCSPPPPAPSESPAAAP